MQFEEAFNNVPEQYEALLRDYVGEDVDHQEGVGSGCTGFDSEQLSDTVEMAQLLGYESVGRTDDFFLQPRGYRQLEGMPRLPRKVAESLVREFGSLKQSVRSFPGGARRRRRGGPGAGPGHTARPRTAEKSRTFRRGAVAMAGKEDGILDKDNGTQNFGARET